MQVTTITVEKVDDINIILSGTLSHSTIAAKVQTLKKQALLTSKIIHKDTLQKDAEGQLLQTFIDEGMSKANIKVSDTLGQPHFKKYEKKKNGIVLLVEISTTPNIDTTIAYMDIVPTFTKPIADPKIVDAKITLMAKQQAPYTTIKSPRPVKNGDFVDIDFQGFLNERALAGANEKNYKLKIGSKSFLPGFEEQMIGFNAKEEQVITILFPKTYKAKELAGKETKFNVKLHEIREQIALSIDDALAKKVLKNDNATLAMLREKMAEQIVSQTFSNMYNTTLKPELIKGLLSKFDFTLPNNIVEQEIDAKVNEIAQAMSKENQAHYKENATKFKTLRDSVRQSAKDSIKAALIVDALAQKEGLEVNEKEIIASLEYQAMRQGKDVEEFVDYYKDNNLMTSIEVGLIEDKLFSKILGLNQ